MVCDRPLLVQVGEYDCSFPAADAMPEYQRIQAIYHAASVPDRLALDRFDGVHEINVGPVLDWFGRWVGRLTQFVRSTIEPPSPQNFRRLYLRDQKWLQFLLEPFRKLLDFTRSRGSLKSHSNDR